MLKDPTELIMGDRIVSLTTKKEGGVSKFAIVGIVKKVTPFRRGGQQLGWRVAFSNLSSVDVAYGRKCEVEE